MTKGQVTYSNAWSNHQNLTPEQLGEASDLCSASEIKSAFSR